MKVDNPTDWARSGVSTSTPPWEGIWMDIVSFVLVWHPPKQQLEITTRSNFPVGRRSPPNQWLPSV